MHYLKKEIDKLLWIISCHWCVACNNLSKYCDCFHLSTQWIQRKWEIINTDRPILQSLMRHTELIFMPLIFCVSQTQFQSSKQNQLDLQVCLPVALDFDQNSIGFHHIVNHFICCNLNIISSNVSFQCDTEVWDEMFSL